MTLSLSNFKNALENENITEIMNFLRSKSSIGAIDVYHNKNGDTALHVIAKKGTPDDAAYLLNNSIGSGKHVQNKKGQTPLHIAIEAKNELMVCCLLQHNCLITFADKDGNLPMHIAAKNQSPQIVALLRNEALKRKAAFERSYLPAMLLLPQFDIHSKNKLHQSAFRIARQSNNESVKSLLASIGGQDHFEDALNFLYQDDEQKLLDLIDAHPYVVHDRDENGNTLLHHVMLVQKESALRIIEKLVRHGADINVENNDKQTALHFLAQLGFHSSATPEASSLLNALLRFGVKVNAANDQGFTPLHYAATQNTIEIVDLLIAKGANKDFAANNGLTPLHVAAFCKKIEVFKHLVERHHAQINTYAYPSSYSFFSGISPEDKPDISPLWIALHTGNKELLEYIVNLKKLRNEIKDLRKLRSVKGDTLFHYFAAQDLLEVCSALSALRLNPFIQNNAGLTALHVAAMMGHENLVKQIVERFGQGFSVDLEIRTKDGKTAWRLAHESNHAAICTYLESKGALQAAVSVPAKSLSERFQDQRKFGAELENTWSYTVGNALCLAAPVVMAAPLGTIAVGAAIGTQMLTYYVPPKLLHYGSQAHYWLRPMLHNYTHWSVESAFDKISYVPRLGLEFHPYITDPLRKACGTIASYGLANATALCTDNKEIQGLAYLAGREMGYMGIDAARHHHLMQTNSTLQEQLYEQQTLQGINISTSLWGREKAEKLVNFLNSVIDTRNVMYQVIGPAAHSIGLATLDQYM